MRNMLNMLTCQNVVSTTVISIENTIKNIYRKIKGEGYIMMKVELQGAI